VSRLVWLGTGAAIGALGVRHAVHLVRPATHHGVHERPTSVGERVQDFITVVREAMAERETELRVALGVDTGTMDEQAARELLEDPTAPRS
jgi:hypothetical protein